jgi:predicted component of type VI protein secretion system
MKLTDLRNLINEEIQYVLNTEAFGQGGKNMQIGTGAKGKGGKRFIPSFVKLPKSVRDAFKGDFKLVKNSEGEYTLYISKDLHAALNVRSTGQNTTTAKSSLKRVNDINALGLPQELKSLLKKTSRLNSSLDMYSIAVKIKEVTPEGDILFDNPATAGTLDTFEGLINEVMDALQEEKHMPIDEIGKLYQVKLADGKMTKEEMVCEVTVFDDINPEETSGVYKNPSEARRHAGEILKEYETKLEEVKAAMEEYRTSKAEIDKKKLAAKDKINGIKGPHNKK